MSEGVYDVDSEEYNPSNSKLNVLYPGSWLLLPIYLTIGFPLGQNGSASIKIVDINIRKEQKLQSL